MSKENGDEWMILPFLIFMWLSPLWLGYIVYCVWHTTAGLI